MLLSSAVLGAQEEAAAFDGYLVRLADERSMVKALPDGCEDLGGGLYYAETSESAAAISASGELLYCKPNYILTIEDCYDDYVPTQWNLLSVGAEAAWAAMRRELLAQYQREALRFMVKNGAFYSFGEPISLYRSQRSIGLE